MAFNFAFERYGHLLWNLFASYNMQLWTEGLPFPDWYVINLKNKREASKLTFLLQTDTSKYSKVHYVFVNMKWTNLLE